MHQALEAGADPGTDPLSDIKRATVDEALEGKRSIDAVATDAGVTGQTLRTWLAEHYRDNPEDPRHHLVNAGGRDAPRGDDGDEPSARDDMGKKQKTRKPRMTLEEAEKLRPKVEAALQVGGASISDVAKLFNLPPSTVSYWRNRIGLGPAKPDPAVEAKKRKAFEMFRAGIPNQRIRGELSLGANTIARFRREYEQAKAANSERMARAREVKAEKLETDPEFRAQVSESLKAAQARKRAERDERINQLALELEGEPITQTIQSNGVSVEPLPQLSAPVSTRQLPRYPAPPPSTTEAFIAESFKECVEERLTLRGMVTLLQREAEQMKRKLDAYRARYGEIQP
jgi:transposase-like protein